jgi:hypothetical protein
MLPRDLELEGLKFEKKAPQETPKFELIIWGVAEDK